jgi:hypothetical protein
MDGYFEADADQVSQADNILASRGVTGALASTYDRLSQSGLATAGAATSGTLRLMLIHLRAGMTVTNITFYSGTTALGTGTHQWFALYDSARNLLGVTGDDTNVAWGASTAKTLALATPYPVTVTGWYYIGYLITVSAGSVPTIESCAGVLQAGSRAGALIPGGNSTAGLTTPASAPNPAGAIAVLGQFNYGEVS